MSYLVVTPARDEADRLPHLAGSLARQHPGLVGLWVVVDDGSTDGTAESINAASLPFPVLVVRRAEAGGLATGGAFVAFRFGADAGLAQLPDATRILKVDADVVLDDNYLELIAAVPGDVELTGGVIASGDQEQADHVRGALKAYSRSAYDIVAGLPAALGWDAMDEVAIRARGGRVVCVPEAKADLTRRTGASEGLLRGRMRGGVVSRWCGYHPLYFALRLLRYAARPPFVIGSLAMLWSYLRAGRGPYPDDLRRAMKREQRRKLGRLARRPARTLRELFPGQ